MKCCIQNCAKSVRLSKLNQSSTSSSTKITFHLFPKDPKLRAAWIKSLAIPNWKPRNRTVICSEHFKEEDFYVTKSGIRRIKHGVVPVIKDDFYESAASRTCKLCLSLDAKMYQLKDYNLEKMYQDIMGMAPRTDVNNRLPMSICWECAAWLQAAASFRSKALISDALLQDHLKTNADLKVTDILKLHRENNNLKSSLLVQEVFKFNSLNLDEHAPNTLTETEVIAIPNNEEIEIEVNHLITNKITIKDEEQNEVIEETYLNGDVKTEIDLTKIEIGETDFEFEDDSFSDDDKVYVKTNDSAGTIIDFGNIVMVKNTEEIVCDDRTNIRSKPLDCVDVTQVSNKPVVCIEDVKITDVKRKKGAVKRKARKDEDDKGSKWVSARKKKTYVKLSVPVDENIFTVKTLSHEQLKQEILERKDSEKYKKAPFKCTVCYRGFSAKDKQTRHVFKHNEQSGPVKCVVCKIRMKNLREMRSHMKKLHTTEFVCKLCPLVTRSKCVAIEHMKFHAGRKYQCPQCPLEFEKKTTLFGHLRIKHMTDCVCELCGYTFISKQGVKSHKAKQHPLVHKNAQLKGPYCEVCEVKFFTQNAYDRHLRLSSKHIKSENDPNRLYNDPSAKSPRLAQYLKSPRRRTPRRRTVKTKGVRTRRVTCERCGVKLENFRTYVAHFKYYHPDIKHQFTYKTICMCEHCGKLFVNSTNLAAHMWVHTGQKQFQCDLCNKTFTAKVSLVKHLQRHAGVRHSYECRLCGNHYANPGNLNRHMFIHTGLKPFKCDACEKAFRTSGELQSHVDHVHLNKPWPKRVRRNVNKCDN